MDNPNMLLHIENLIKRQKQRRKQLTESFASSRSPSPFSRVFENPVARSRTDTTSTNPVARSRTDTTSTNADILLRQKEQMYASQNRTSPDKSRDSSA